MTQLSSHGESVAVIRVQVYPELLAEEVPVAVPHTRGSQAGNHGQKGQEFVHLEYFPWVKAVIVAGQNMVGGDQTKMRPPP